MIRGMLMLLGVTVVVIAAIVLAVWAEEGEKHYSVPFLFTAAFIVAGYLGYVRFGGWW